MPSWIGPWEIAIVLVLALLIFGPKKLPDLGSSLGRSITGFKKGLKETKEERDNRELIASWSRAPMRGPVCRHSARPFHLDSRGAGVWARPSLRH
jgi:sec-independent protein translocase protein TatA